MKRIVKIGARAVEYTLISSSARTSLPTQALQEVECLPYATAIPERKTRGSVEAVSGTKGACAG